MINKKRIRNVSNYLYAIKDGEDFFVVKEAGDVSLKKMKRIGFSDGLINGAQVLPSIVGPVTRFNAKGGFYKFKNLPMETVYRSVCVKDWHGNDHYVDVPYKRYPRENIMPPSVELKIVDIKGAYYFISPKMRKSVAEEQNNKHIINLFLELFGSCEIFNQSYESAISTIPTKRVNWHILPEGEYPWNRMLQLAGNLLSKRVGKSKMQKHNITTIARYKPKEIIYGIGGFRGYLVFVFPEKNLFVMENVIYGNATYVFDDNWERFSQLTKAEIIKNNFQKYRFEHHKGWEDKIKEILS